MVSGFFKCLKKESTSSKVDFIHEDYQSLKKRPFYAHVNLFNASIADCFRPVLYIVQLTGLLPVNYNDNRFSATSFKFIYSLIVALSILGMSIISFAKALRDHLEFDKVVEFMFYFIDLLVVVQFQVLATQWANITALWSDFERTLNQNEQLLGKRISLKISFQIIILIGTAMTIIAEVLEAVAGIEKSAQCVGVLGESQRYFKQQFPQLFSIVEFALWKGILVQLLKLFCTFIRMFLDVFLILISLGLSRLISRLNLQYNSPRSNRVITEEFWVRYKDHYLKFVRLVEFVDKQMGHLIIICFLSDLYLICVRILKSLKSLDTARHALYFWYALLFLILRLVCVCFFASNLHKEAKRPLQMLRNVPASCWSIEAQRFQDLVAHNDVCLTGMGFFKLRRTLLLSISGTIVTYELVLMQFNDSGSLEPTDKNPCS